MNEVRALDIARFGLLTAVALVLGYIESLIPLVPGIPGIKLGIANTVLLYAVYMMRAPHAVMLMIAKVLLSGFLFAGVSGMIYSLAGGILSVAVMLLSKRIKGVSVVGVSVLGACAHNTGQLAVAGAVVGTRAMLSFLPVLLLSALAAGIVTGVAAKYVFSGVEREKRHNDK